MKNNSANSLHEKLLYEILEGKIKPAILSALDTTTWAAQPQKLVALILKHGANLNAETIWLETKDRDLVVFYIDLLNSREWDNLSKKVRNTSGNT